LGAQATDVREFQLAEVGGKNPVFGEKLLADFRGFVGGGQLGCEVSEVAGEAAFEV
jgi:hypothetical protein